MHYLFFLISLIRITLITCKVKVKTIRSFSTIKHENNIMIGAKTISTLNAILNSDGD